MDVLEVRINGEEKFRFELEYTDPVKLLRSFEGMVKFSEENKGSALKMAKGLKRLAKNR